ncbi:MAG: hypothetical protein EDM75_06995 [Chlorobiota bacterium]|nr:MAG: hypothetical protein EDM75_06995 [Chlorobiota bacterium]
MKKNNYTILIGALLILFLFSGCDKPEPVFKVEKTSGSGIIALFDAYINGDEKAEVRLRDPFDLNILDAKFYRKAEIDSVVLDGEKFYGLLIQHKDPAHSKFLIYNDTLGLLLQDRDLAGSLLLKKLFIGEKEFFAVVQKFSVKTVINAEKIKIYDIKEGRGSLLFDNFTEVSSPTLFGSMTVSSKKNEPLGVSFKLYGSKASFKPVKIEYTEEGVLSDKLVKWKETLTSHMQKYTTKEETVPITEQLPKYYNTKFDLLRMYLPEKWEVKSGVEIKTLFEDKVTGTVAARKNKDISVFIFDLEKNSPVRAYIRNVTFDLLSDEFNYSLYASAPATREDILTRFVLARCENEEYLVAIRCKEAFYKNNFPLINYMINSINLNCFQ